MSMFFAYLVSLLDRAIGLLQNVYPHRTTHKRGQDMKCTLKVIIMALCNTRVLISP